MRNSNNDAQNCFEVPEFLFAPYECFNDPIERKVNDFVPF